MRILARVSHQGQSTGNAQHTGRIDTSKLFLRQKFNLPLANRVESIDTNNHGLKDDAVPEQESARIVEAWVYAYGEAGLFAWFAQQRRP